MCWLTPDSVSASRFEGKVGNGIARSERMWTEESIRTFVNIVRCFLASLRKKKGFEQDKRRDEIGS